MIDKKKLANALRGQDQPDKGININITLDMSGLAKVMKEQGEPKADEYQKVDGLSHNVSG